MGSLAGSASCKQGGSPSPQAIGILGPLRSSWFFPAIAALWSIGALLLQLLRVVEADGVFSARDALALIKHMKSDDHLTYNESANNLLSAITFANVALVSLASLVIIVSLRIALTRSLRRQQKEDGEKSACMEWVQFAVAIIVFNLSLTAVYHLLVLLRRDVVVVTLHCGGPPQFLPVADAAAMLSGGAPPPGCEVRTFDMLLNLTDLCTALFLVHYALVCVGGSARKQAQQRRHSISRTVLVASLFSLSLCIPFDAVIAWTPAMSTSAQAGTVISAIVSIATFVRMIRVSKRWERVADRSVETDRERLVRQTSSSLRVPLAVLASLQTALGSVDMILTTSGHNESSLKRAVQFAFIVNKGVTIPASVAIIGVCACIVFSHQLIHERLVEEAKANVESQKLVIRYVCHEVRVPLNSMLMGMELLMDMLQASHLLDGDAPDAAQLEAPDAAMSLDPSDVADARATVQQMFLGAGSMKRILNDVLTVASLEQGRVSLIKEPFALGRVLRVVNSTFQADARRRGVTLRCVNDTESLPPGLSLLGDADRLIQVLSNLVSNALKFTPSGREVSIVFRLVVPRNFVPVAELAAGTQSMPSMTEVISPPSRSSQAASLAALPSVARSTANLENHTHMPISALASREIPEGSHSQHSGLGIMRSAFLTGTAGGTPTPLATNDAPTDSGYSTSLSNPTQGTQSASTLRPDSSRGSNPHINSSYNSGATEMPPVVQRRTRWLLECRVVDQGVGIAEEDLQKLFQPFQQLGSGKKERQNGTGLGLSICKNIIHLHGGEMGVVSTGEGQGSTFWFRVPLRAAPHLRDDSQPDSPAEQAHSPESEARNQIPAPMGLSTSARPADSRSAVSRTHTDASGHVVSVDTASNFAGPNANYEVAASPHSSSVNVEYVHTAPAKRSPGVERTVAAPTWESDSSYSSQGSAEQGTPIAFVHRFRALQRTGPMKSEVTGPPSRVLADEPFSFSTTDRHRMISDLRRDFQSARNEVSRVASGETSARRTSREATSSSSDVHRPRLLDSHEEAVPSAVCNVNSKVELDGSSHPVRRPAVLLAPLDKSGLKATRRLENDTSENRRRLSLHLPSLGSETSSRITARQGDQGQLRGSVHSEDVTSPVLPTTPAPPPGPRIPSHRLANITAVVVDDVQGNRMLLARLLRREGCTVHEAEHGAAALSTVGRLLDPVRDHDTTPPGRIVVLMDANMPVMGGLEAATELRRRHGGRVRVIGVTGSATEEERSAYVAAGADEVLVKPVGKKDLLAAIEQALRALNGN